MYTRADLVRLAVLIIFVVVTQTVVVAHAQSEQVTTRQIDAYSFIRGIVKDPLGGVVGNATVELLDESGTVVSMGHTNLEGAYQIAILKSGQFGLRVSANTFDATSVPLRFYAANRNAYLNLTLSTPTLTQQVTVTATGTPTPLAQVGASVTFLNADDYRYQSEVQNPLREVSGVQITQSGQIGGTSGMNIRGASTDANKVLIDGVPANAIGGGVEFSNIATVGIQSIEVLREPDSALYGSDALAGVVNLTSTRGTTPLPLFTYAGDAGNFHTYRNEVTAGTVYRCLDLYSAFARIDTGNNIPNSEFHNATYAGNFGWTPNATNDLRFTVRNIVTSSGQPNAIAFFGIPDDAQQKERDNYYGLVWNNQTTPLWHNEVRYGSVRQNPDFYDYAATGKYNAATDTYLGDPVVITGANGYRVNGQAIFQYGSSYGVNYPSQFLSPTSRDFAHAQSDYSFQHIAGHDFNLVALLGFKYEKESGSSGYTGSLMSIQRGNYSYTLQLGGNLQHRLFYNLGSGLEDNGLFGFAATPRASLAYYIVRPSDSEIFAGTKVHGSFGKGIKEPSVYQQLNSLSGYLPTVAPLGPENSRTFDAGIDQQFFNGRIRANITYFHDEFTNSVEYVPQSSLVQLGLPAVPFGAYVNSLAFQSQGIEFESEYRFGDHLLVRGGYTYTDAVVQHSFSSDAVGPSFNTSFNFGTIPIGADSPLVGARPFRIAPHTGYFSLHYMRPRFYASLTGTLVGKRDDSDFLCDNTIPYGCGTSLLLPNRNLLGAYQRLELGIGYQLTPRLNLYSDIQNLLSEHYYEAFGFPSLPLTFRTGVRVTFGGESWKLN